MSLSSRKQNIRREMRRLRQALSHTKCIDLSEKISGVIKTLVPLKAKSKVACYLSNDGEADLSKLISQIWASRHHCYLPKLNGDQLQFGLYTEGTAMLDNRFGIPEPQQCPMELCPPWELDLVLMPLVAFNLQGARIGMGGGFYDRTFSFKLHEKFPGKPRLIGVAYEFQQFDLLASEYWDVPLDAIATEVGLREFHRYRIAEL